MYLHFTHNEDTILLPQLGIFHYNLIMFVELYISFNEYGQTLDYVCIEVWFNTNNNNAYIKKAWWVGTLI